MHSSELFTKLQDPSVYGSKVEDVQIIQTHISFVVLTGECVYKIKKPVSFGFLDFSTLEKRKYYCQQEVLLNKRLCPQLYLDVVAITDKDGVLSINGQGKPVEYAVKMKEFPQKALMSKLLSKNMIATEHIDKICKRLIDFYADQQPSQEVLAHGSLQGIRQNIDENFQQTKNMIGITITTDQWHSIKKSNESFFSRCASVFKERVEQQKIKDCHGDLHSGNIVIEKDICIFDCIEFNTRFRYIDVASDIGFLAMDLDMANHPFLSSYLVTLFVEKTNDVSLLTVLQFYKSYRAFVRGKVLGFTIQDKTIPAKTKKEMIATAQQYFTLSSYYSQLFSFDYRNHPPLLFMVSGVTGTGKSTLAQKLSVDYHATHVNTDIIRKQQEGISEYTKVHEPFDTGLYASEKRLQTYKALVAEAEQLLLQGKNVVLDATFQKQEYRQLVYDMVKGNKALLFHVFCECDDSIAYERLTHRMKQKNVSDGRCEIYHKQKANYDAFGVDEKLIRVDTGKESFEDRMQMYTNILRSVLEVI